MKKIYKTALFAIMGNIALAQSFFIPTTYRGAFAPAPTAMWTDTWTEWDPQNAVYPTPTVTVTASITTNTTWTSGNTYLLSGQIYVKNGATLTIQPGTVIRGDKSATGAGLFICQGSKLMAVGTVNQPIIFTSDQGAGLRGLGDWGGVILMGKAANNQAGGVAYIEGLASSPDTQYGGGASPDDADNSGVMQYVRIEFGGYVYLPNKEINGLTMGSVGSATTIDHIQVSFANDDGYEWFGGTVNAKYLVSYRNLDDDFDTDFGFRGHIQFGVSVRDPSIADNPSVSTSEGFESDNDATGTTATPQTAAVFSNMTLIGPYRGNTASSIAPGYRRGARIRRNSGLKIYNSIFMDHQRGIHIDGGLCEALATSGGLKFRNNIVAGNSTNKVCEVNAGSSFGITSWFGTSANDSLISTSGILTTPYNYTAPDYRPAGGSPALTNSDYTDGGISPFVLFAPTATSTITYCEGATASALSATPASGHTLNWYTVATGGTASSTAPTPSTAVAGTTTYYVSQTNGAGYESARTSIDVVVNPTPAVPTISLGGSTTFCAGGSLILTSSAGSGNMWTSTETTNSITVGTSGTYGVTVTNGFGCSATSSTVSVTVNPLPTPSVSAGGTTTFCAGGSVTLLTGTFSSYLWSNGATTQSTSVNTSGNQSVTVTDGNGCQATSSATTVTVNPLPSTPIISAGGPTSFCTGGSVVLTSSASSGNMWSTSATTNSITVNASGSYSVTETDGNGCQATSAATTVNVSSAPLPTIATSGATTICSGNTVMLTSSTADTYLWSTSETTQSITVTVGGTYHVTTTNTNACDGVGQSADITVTVNPVPTAAGGVASISGSVITFMNTSVGATTYSWDFGDFSSSSATNPVHAYATNGNYLVTLIAMSGGCSDTITFNTSISVGVTEVQVMGGVTLYPNPANQEATIEISLNQSSKVSVNVYDITGKVVADVYNGSMDSGMNSLKVNVSELPAGIYFTTIISDKTKKTLKLVVVK